MSFYRFIGTYSTDSGNLSTWGGAHSSTAFNAPGTSTYWGSDFQVSAFDVDGTLTPGSGYTDVLNTASGYGTDMLNMGALIDHIQTTQSLGSYSYTTSNTATFNWGGNPASPGGNYDNITIASDATYTGMTNYTERLDASAWGLVRNYEAVLGHNDAADNWRSITITNFQTTNLKLEYTGGEDVNIVGAQRGTIDLTSLVNSGVNLDIGTARVSGSSDQSTFVIEAGTQGVNLTVHGASGTGVATTDYASNALVTTGAGTQIDVYGAGSNNIDLTGTLASSYIHMAGEGGAMSFLLSETDTLAAGGDVVRLSSSGSAGASTIATDTASGAIWVDNFTLGRDFIDLNLGASGTYSVNSFGTGNSDVGYGNHGVMFAGVSTGSLSGHLSTAVVGSDTHLYVH